MRYKKIRGQKRVWKAIDTWKKANKRLDLEEIHSRQRDYVKIWVHPFSSISMSGSEFPEPKGKTRMLLLNGLFDIYYSWKKQLDLLGEPYYLKIWLYEPNFSRSQVVCGIGSFLTFYESTFYIPQVSKQFPEELLGKTGERAVDFQWDYALEEEHLDEDFIGDPEDFISDAEFLKNRRWFRNKLKGPVRISSYDGKECYSIKKGNVWLGQIPEVNQPK